MSKEKWAAFKEEALKIKQEIARLNAECMFPREANAYEGFKRATLIRMNHNFGTGNLSKQQLREALSHFGQLAYVDMHGKAKQITLRFSTQGNMEGFLTKAAELAGKSIESIGSAKLKASEALTRAIDCLSGG